MLNTLEINAMCKGSVLLVEDSDIQRRLIQRLLLACDRPVETVDNGEDAVRYALETDPDLILMDIDMPGMNGLDACRAISRNPHTQHIPIVMLSSYEDKAYRLRAAMRGAVDYLVKPVTREQLCNTLAPILNNED